MIIKTDSIDKIDFIEHRFFLIYGKNNGLKEEIISKIITKNSKKKIYRYDEAQIFEESKNFYENILNESLFNEKKLIIINKSTDKLLEIILEIYSKKNIDSSFVINSEILSKSSKIRNFFEKDKSNFILPVYPDTVQSLSIIANKFFKEKKIAMSQLNVNLIINKCNSDREFLKKELSKIELFLYNKKNIDTHELSKLINLTENHEISELVNSCLSYNSKKTSFILNENSFNNEDCILIIRTFLAKTKKILKLADNYAKNNNLEMTIAEAKPPIFWKEKDLVKLQLLKWKPSTLKRLIFNINQLELEIKKNSQSSLNILTNFIFDQVSSKT